MSSISTSYSDECQYHRQRWWQAGELTDGFVHTAAPLTVHLMPRCLTVLATYEQNTQSKTWSPLSRSIHPHHNQELHAQTSTETLGLQCGQHMDVHAPSWSVLCFVGRFTCSRAMVVEFAVSVKAPVAPIAVASGRVTWFWFVSRVCVALP